MYKIVEYDKYACEVRSADFSHLDDCSAYEDAVVKSRAAQYVIINTDNRTVMWTHDAGACTEEHSVDRMYG